MSNIKNIESPERRQFFSMTSKFGFTAATIAATSGLIMSQDAVAAISKEEKEREDNCET